ncbi:MAG: cyclase family protein [Anaerolineae bacterium]|nr:cyclase family protein [Anaerolineae bacterium]
MAIIDISRTLDARLAVWPGDAPFALEVVSDRRAGAGVNLTTLTLGAHTGTHIDAPHHIADSARAVDALDLASYWGLAQVVTVAKTVGPLTLDDLAHADLGRARRLLVRSQASTLDPAVFPPHYVYPSAALADALGELGICLYGADAPSVDPVDSQALPGHHALLRNGIAILEGLDLSCAPDGIYELVALPLKIAAGDGSPVRAALRTIDPPP